MKYFITTDNGHIEDILGDRATFNTIEDAVSFLNENHSDWIGDCQEDEGTRYEIGPDDGLVWNTLEVITL